jgi:hypothetical protein
MIADQLAAQMNIEIAFLNANLNGWHKNDILIWQLLVIGINSIFKSTPSRAYCILYYASGSVGHCGTSQSSALLVSYTPDCNVIL